jgi:hypothetical protein
MRRERLCQFRTMCTNGSTKCVNLYAHSMQLRVHYIICENQGTSIKPDGPVQRMENTMTKTSIKPVKTLAAAASAAGFGKKGLLYNKT